MIVITKFSKLQDECRFFTIFYAHYRSPNLYMNVMLAKYIYIFVYLEYICKSIQDIYVNGRPKLQANSASNLVVFLGSYKKCLLYYY